MFGFSLTKLLVLAAIVSAIWYAFKLIGRLDQRRKREIKARRDNPGGGGAVNVPGKPEEMVQCPVCESYVAAQGVGPCGRDDCPY